jgi:2-desacetyl-2-hydroxyethyl bacteriochlorophyllide A dehydrogenase
MKSHYVAFTAPNQAELLEEEVSPSDLGENEALVRAEYSIVSSGTEGAGYTDLVRQMLNLQNLRLEYPRRTGYGHLGRVIAVGPNTRDLHPGDRVLSFSRHASIATLRAASEYTRFAIPVPDDVDGKKAVLTRMGGVAITAIRSSTVQPGDRVAVIGLGLVGNLAAQLFQLAGARVVGLDPVAKRREVARACGIREVIDPTAGDPVAAIREWSGDGQGAEVVVEAVGRSDLVMQAVEMTRRFGEVILLGSPRAHLTADVTPTFTRIHLLAIRMIGALEGTYPFHGTTERVRFSVESNFRQVLGCIAEERLVVAPLISHVLSPRRCQDAYDGLTKTPSEFTGVIFDWGEFA